jgi:hypothetical protein
MATECILTEMDVKEIVDVVVLVPFPKLLEAIEASDGG